MAQESQLIFLVLLMALVTFIPRVLPFLLSIKRYPKWLSDAMEFVPITIIAAITIPPLLLDGITQSRITAEIMAAAVCVLIALWSKNLFITVVAGTAFFIGLNLWFFD